MKQISATMCSGIMASAMIVGAPMMAAADDHEGMDVPTIAVSVVLDELDNPWDMAFLPDGTMFYTEKCEGLSVRTADGTVHALYGMDGTTGFADSGSDLFCEGQAGMLGVVADMQLREDAVTCSSTRRPRSTTATAARRTSRDATAIS